MKCIICGKDAVEANAAASGTDFLICAGCAPIREQAQGAPIKAYSYPWQCPKCGSIYGPTVMECYRCNPAPVVTC